MIALIVYALALVAIAGMIVFDGWAVSLIWNWYLVPFGAPPMFISWAIGLVCVRSLIIPTKRDNDNKTNEDKWKDIGFALGKITIVLLIAWAAHFWMPVR